MVFFEQVLVNGLAEEILAVLGIKPLFWHLFDLT